MSLNSPQGRDISDTVSHMGMSAGFPEGPIKYVLQNDREIILVGIRSRKEMPPINSENGSISVSNSNLDWARGILGWEIQPIARMNPVDLVIYYAVETIKETFKIRKGKVNPGNERNMEGIAALLLLITFLITCFLQALNLATVPEVLVRPVDLGLGYFFGRGRSKVDPPG